VIRLFPPQRLKERALLIAVVISTVVIILFGVLQYQWSQEVSDAAAVRLADTLQMSMVNWQIDLLRNFSEIAASLDTNAPVNAWRDSARYPALVRRVYTSATPRAGSTAVVPSLELQQGKAPVSWQFDTNEPALVRMVTSRATAHPPEWLVVELDRHILRDQILPDLARRYFQGTDGLDYEIAVIATGPPRSVLYSSDPGFGERAVGDADGTLQVFGDDTDPSSRQIRVFHRTSGRHDATAPRSFPPLAGDLTGARPGWELVVRHRRGGPLGAFVADTHRRDLTLSSAALLLLLASIVMLVVTSTRAQRLAALQMDFVTAVTHELRTPLTVISSAADNIAQGVVDTPGQILQYGSVIGAQASQLSTLVEQILLFASHSKGSLHFTMQPLAVRDIIDATLSSTQGLLDAAHFRVERDVPSDLPLVRGDLVALTQCLQNLVTNALKYGRDQRWLAIRARVVASAAPNTEVQIAVEDRGIGIARSDLPRIFEPFYRSASASAAQIHGTGLGLALAKSVAEAMGGHLTVSSDVGRGSIFTIHLPALDAVASPVMPLHTSSSIQRA
jgi:signal transduction histidine kinase